MKKEIEDICLKLNLEQLSVTQATEQLFDLYNAIDNFILVRDQEPPHNIELLVKSPTGSIHLCDWRPAYNIFTCQSKSESSLDWKWKLI